MKGTIIMLKKYMLNSALGLSSVLFSSFLMAAAASDTTSGSSTTSTSPSSTSSSPSTSGSQSQDTRSTSSQELTKDEWLGKLRAAVPDLICKGFLQDDTLSKRLTEVNINYDKCVTLIPASVDKCEKELYSQIPATINQESAGKWGHSIGECIGKDFALKHLFNNNSSSKQQ
ncbi:Uncharacterised protein [Legionella beliardensis]|uniref:T2SS substrate NttA domain-containing protein n=1 Tax=Legionella beliardensis TaxID=91822 RepID=A0A378ICM4_9GAMM|nr:hypothetical protein [Legionella beliardensis]STX30054.1 Uncharacterised protein [Legionella beliardensis]